MATREELRRRPDVPKDDLDDIVEIASRLQDEDRGKVRVDEVEKVAAELDIDPKYVEQAIATLKSERAAADVQKQADAAAASQRTRTIGLVGGVVALLGLLAAIVFGGAVLAAAGSVNAAADQAGLAATNLDTVLDREASLAPQLLGLAGGDPSALKPLAAEVSGAGTVDERLKAAQELDAALAEQLGKLPPADDASAGTRADVQTELVGVQNRITTERRRYDQAVTSWRQAADGPLAGIAVKTGLAKAPPP